MAVLSNRPNKAAHYSNIVVNHQRRVEYFFLTITEEIKNKNNCVPATTMTSQVSSLVVTAQQKRADSSISQGKIWLVKLDRRHTKPCINVCQDIGKLKKRNIFVAFVWCLSGNMEPKLSLGYFTLCLYIVDYMQRAIKI